MISVTIIMLAYGKFIYKVEEEVNKGLKIANIDTMEGIEFENYLQKLLIHQGYVVKLTPASGDFGVDLVASRDNKQIAIQAKRQDSAVSRRAISDAVAGMNYYHCNDAMVITNNFFTPDAKTLADSNNCTLVDRDTLARWINDYQNYKTRIETPKKIVFEPTNKPLTTIKSQELSKPASSVNFKAVVESSNTKNPQYIKDTDEGDRNFEIAVSVILVGGLLFIICLIIWSLFR